MYIVNLGIKHLDYIKALTKFPITILVPHYYYYNLSIARIDNTFRLEDFDPEQWKSGLIPTCLLVSSDDDLTYFDLLGLDYEFFTGKRKVNAEDALIKYMQRRGENHAVV